MLKLTQFHISASVASSDTVTYQAIDKTTGLPVFLHFLPKTEARYLLQAQLAKYIEACKARRLPVTLAIDEGQEFMVSPPIENFTSLGHWMEQQIASMRTTGPSEAEQEKTLDLSWLKYADAKYDRPVSSASEFGFRPREPQPKPNVEAAVPARLAEKPVKAEEPPAKSPAVPWRLIVLIAVAVAIVVLALTAGGSSR